MGIYIHWGCNPVMEISYQLRSDLIVQVSFQWSPLKVISEWVRSIEKSVTPVPGAEEMVIFCNLFLLVELNSGEMFCLEEVTVQVELEMMSFQSLSRLCGLNINSTASFSAMTKPMISDDLPLFLELQRLVYRLQLQTMKLGQQKQLPFLQGPSNSSLQMLDTAYSG
jgi:hypothetical protein